MGLHSSCCTLSTTTMKSPRLFDGAEHNCVLVHSAVVELRCGCNAASVPLQTCQIRLTVLPDFATDQLRCFLRAKSDDS